MNIYSHYHFSFRDEGKAPGSPSTLRVTSEEEMTMWPDNLP